MSTPTRSTRELPKEPGGAAHGADAARDAEIGWALRSTGGREMLRAKLTAVDERSGAHRYHVTLSGQHPDRLGRDLDPAPDHVIELPQVVLVERRLEMLADKLGRWLAAPLITWRDQPFALDTQLADGRSEQRFRLRWSDDRRYILTAGQSVLRCSCRQGLMALRSDFVVDPTVLSAFHGELVATLRRA